MISLRYLRENNAKLRGNKQKLASTTVRVVDYGVCLSPAQESAPGNDGDVPAVSKGAGISLILHPRYGFSIRRVYVHRGIIIPHTG